MLVVATVSGPLLSGVTLIRGWRVKSLMTMCLNVLGGRACVRVVKTYFVTGCVHSWEVRTAVDAATNYQYLKLLTTWNQALHMFEKRGISEEGDAAWTVDLRVSSWADHSLKPAALTGYSDKLVTLDFSSSVYSVHSQTSENKPHYTTETSDYRKPSNTLQYVWCVFWSAVLLGTEH